jgi:hypothetical protein
MVLGWMLTVFSGASMNMVLAFVLAVALMAGYATPSRQPT